ncbi:hypothetical protein ACLB1O_30790 [Escherichia coli]
MRGAAPAALPARLSGQKVVYGCMQGTGVIFRALSPFLAVFYCAHFGSRLPGGIRSSGPTPTGSCWRTRQFAEPAGAVSGCRYGPCVKTRACSDRSGRAAPVAP